MTKSSAQDVYTNGYAGFDVAATKIFKPKDLKVDASTSILKYDSLTTNDGAICFIEPLTVEEYD